MDPYANAAYECSSVKHKCSQLLLVSVQYMCRLLLYFACWTLPSAPCKQASSVCALVCTGALVHLAAEQLTFKLFQI